MGGEEKPTSHGSAEPDGTVTASDDGLPVAAPASTPLPPALATVPSDYYQIEGEVGRGGVGVVLRAHDRRLSRRVALKQLQQVEPRSRQRFEREMRITAKLQHPGIVPIHEAGVLESGSPFYAMKLIEGRSLKELIADAKTMQERLELLPTVIAVVETIAYAHSQGVVHRDLKPSNVIVGAFGETVVIDWGLAKDLGSPDIAGADGGPYRRDPGDDMTVAGTVVGTPAYMPPEQARGEEVDKTADVYALGAILRQLVTGKTPYSATSSQGVIDAILVGPPPKLDLVAPEAPADLRAVVDKAMARDLATRYPDAAELLEETQRFAKGRLVSAYSYAASERLRKWVSRRRGIVVTVSIAGLAFLLLGSLSFARIASERDGAVSSKREAIAKANALIREQASHEIDRGFAIGAIQVLKKYPREATDWNDILQLVSRTALLGLPDTWTFEASSKLATNGPRITPDGRFVVIPRNNNLEVWNLEEGRVAADVPVVDGAARITRFEAATLARRSTLVVGTDHGELVFIELSLQGRPVKVESHEICRRTAIESLLANDSGSMVAVGCADGRVFAWVVSNGTETPLHKHSRGGLRVSFLGNDVIASVAADGQLLMSLSGGRDFHSPISVGAPVTVMTAKGGCRQVVIGTDKGTIVTAFGESLDSKAEFVVDAGTPLASVGIDDNCRFIFGVSAASRLVVFALASGQTLYAGTARNAVAYPKRSAIVIGDEGGELSFFEPFTGWKQAWRVSTSPLSLLMVSDVGSVAALGDALVSFSASRFPEVFSWNDRALTLAAEPDESVVTLGGLDGGIGVLDLDTHMMTDLGRIHTGLSLVRSAETRGTFSVGARDGCVYSWHGAQPSEPLFCTQGGVRDIAVNDNKSVETLTDSGLAVRYDLQSSTTRVTHVDGATRISARTDGGALVSTLSGVVALDSGWGVEWSEDLGAKVGQTLELHSGDIMASDASGAIVAIRHDGKRDSLGTCGGGAHRTWFSASANLFLGACEDGTIVASPHVEGLEDVVLSGATMDVDGSPEGDAFASCSSGGNVVVINTRDKTAVALASTIPLENIELLSKRGLVIASASKQGIIVVWDYAANPKSYTLDKSSLYDWLHSP